MCCELYIANKREHFIMELNGILFTMFEVLYTYIV